QKPQRVRRVVCITNRQLTAQRFGRRVERRLEIVVGALLPVAGSWRARAAAEFVAGRKIQRREQRRVTDAGTVEANAWRGGPNVTRGLPARRRRAHRRDG